MALNSCEDHVAQQIITGAPNHGALVARQAFVLDLLQNEETLREIQYFYL